MARGARVVQWVLGWAGANGLTTPDIAARVGRDAVAQAKTGAQGPRRTVALASAPPVVNGNWVTPIEIDPFEVSWEEILDVINGFSRFVGTQPLNVGAVRGVVCSKDVRTFASTEGSLYTQTLYRTGLPFGVAGSGGRRNAEEIVNLAGAGWEYVLRAPIEQHAERFIAQTRLQAEPVDVGRYDIVFDGTAMAKLADITLQPATQLDRAMGYLANVQGTSYLNDPLEMVGTHKVGSPLLTVTANRSMPGGAATVQWDEEGVTPADTTLVKDGILTDFQTTRESASWLADYYQKTGQPVRSQGGAICSAVSDAPTQGAPNMVIVPSRDATSFETLCAGVTKGLAVLGGAGRADQQALSTEFYGDMMYEIKNGKLGRVVKGGVIVARAPEIWQNVVGLGGAQSVASVGVTARGFGWPVPPHTISAPAALVKQVAVLTNAVRML